MKRPGILAVSVLLSIGACFISFLLWYDNRVGFRDAGAMADLVAASFGMISVIWLACAVFMQKSELILQRAELILQREEIARLALANESQNEILSRQNVSSLQAHLASVVQGLVNSQWEHLENSVNDLQYKLEENKRKELDGDATFKRRKVNSEDVSLFFDCGEKELVETRTNYAEIAELMEPRFQFNVLRRVASVARRNNVVDWYRKDLPFLISTSGDLATANLYLLLNAAIIDSAK